MSDQEIPLTPEAKEEGQDPNLTSAPAFEEVKKGQVDANDNRS